MIKKTLKQDFTKALIDLYTIKFALAYHTENECKKLLTEFVEAYKSIKE